MGEVLGIVCRTVLVHPDLSGVKQVIAQHVQEGSKTDNGAKQVRSLRQCCANQEPGIGTSADGKFARKRMPLLQEPLRSKDEIVNRILTVLPLPSQMPRFA